MPQRAEGDTPAPPPPRSIETPASWRVAWTVLAILSVAYGAPLVIVVALRPIAADLGEARAVPSLASSLTFLGAGAGGILMGWIAGRLGVRRVALFGAAMIAAGMALAARGGTWQLLLGYGLLTGVLGIGALFAPLLTYVTLWFDRRRGTALALVSSGQYVAGVVWPAVLERAVAAFGWQRTMLGFGALATAVIAPLAAVVLRPPPAPPAGGLGAADGPRPGARTLGLPPNLALALLATAAFLCCVPMAMPAAHLVAFCADLGIGPARGAAMLSVLLLAAFLARQFWGWVADRIGGLPTVLLGSAAQAVAMGLFLATEDEALLFAVAAIYGLGFSGIIPSYVLTVRELFPAKEAPWRVPVLLFLGLGGMAFGAWLGGALYDRYGYYAPAFAAGIAANLLNLAIVGFLVSRRGVGRLPRPAPAA
ncbi:MFS transporter [Caldovatus aquaticus]|uniref:MFS transporter n=1 Tax=Caldovatus aquaticus TaxID=2865671 RepID=A0ABS7F4D0_9PROT|nr:MFS transporter [Caldovatus aquaticus]MBW8270383.1 MFS transporter [Caldovatus aquaticus]